MALASVAIPVSSRWVTSRATADIRRTMVSADQLGSASTMSRWVPGSALAASTLLTRVTPARYSRKASTLFSVVSALAAATMVVMADLSRMMPNLRPTLDTASSEPNLPKTARRFFASARKDPDVSVTHASNPIAGFGRGRMPTAALTTLRTRCPVRPMRAVVGIAMWHSLGRLDCRAGR